MERCPVCHARWRDVVCFRCGADLMPLLRLEQRAQSLEAAGVRQYAAGDPAAAVTLLEQSLRCQRRPLARALADYLRGGAASAVPPPGDEEIFEVDEMK